MSERVITVQTSYELSLAISTLSVGPGGTILVENTDAPYLLSRFQTGPDQGTINIRPADPADPPTFAQVKLVDSQNISFSGFVFDSTQTEISGKDLQILQSTGLTFDGNTFVNSASGFYTGEDPSVSQGTSLALIRDSAGIVFSNNDVSQYNQGLAVVDSTGLTIAGNAFSKMVGDGVRLTGVQDTLVEGNTFTDFYGSTQNVNHSDMLQVWSAPYNTQITQDLTIRGNVFNSSGGVGTQTIFIKNETFPTTGTAFRNITIEDNTIYNGHQHGVAIYDTIGVTVTGNTILWNPDATMQSNPDATPVNSKPTIRLNDVSEAVVSGNIVSDIYAPGADVSGNMLVTYSDPNSDAYVGAHFVNAVDAGAVDLRDLSLLPDSPWAGVFGSSLTQPLGQPLTQPIVTTEGITPVIRQEQDISTFGQVIYDASLSVGADGTALPAQGTTYTWVFEDGATLTGATVTHRFDAPGVHTVDLWIETASGTVGVSRSTVIEPDVLVALDFNGGAGALVDASSYDSTLDLRGTPSDVSGVDGLGFELSGTTDLLIERENAQIHNLSSFTIDLAVQRAAGGDAGSFLHMHRGLRAEVTDAGSFAFTLRTSDGVFTLQTEDGLISDTDWHDLTVGFDGQAIGLYVDDVLAAQTAASGTMVITGSGYDLVIGDTWGDSLQGRIDDFVLRSSVADVAEAADMPAPAPAPAPEAVPTLSAPVPSELAPSEPTLSDPAPQQPAERVQPTPVSENLNPLTVITHVPPPVSVVAQLFDDAQAASETLEVALDVVGVTDTFVDVSGF